MKFRYILFLIGILTAAPRVSGQINAEQIVKVGQNALYFDDYVLSIQYFNRAIAAKPYMAQPYFFRAIAKLNLEDFRGAESDATASIERNPFVPEVYEVRGVARQNLGKLRGAVEDYDRAMELLPNNRNLMFNRALAIQQLGETDSARMAFDRLIEIFPGYANGYVGRARILIEKSDTVGALADLDHALDINSKMANAYVIRASIRMSSPEGYGQAENDISEAIKLEPKQSDLYVNRAFLRYNRDDYFGAMADYDYALQIDPINIPALFNRGVLRMESRDNDRAIKDFSQVLDLDPEDYRALYNRVILYTETRNYRAAMADIARLIDRFPELPEAYYMRSDINRRQGKMGAAEADYKRALALAKALPRAGSPEAKALSESAAKVGSSGAYPSSQDAGTPTDESGSGEELSAETVARRFTALRTIDRDVDLQQDFVNQGIRGRVQDRDRVIALEPMFALGYYSSSTNTVADARSYIKEVEDLNATHALPFLLMVGNKGLTPSDESLLDRHFASIENYNKLMANGEPRAIDFFGRAMDYMTLRNYPAAIADLDRAIALTPDFAMAYFARGIARYDMLRSSGGGSLSGASAGAASAGVPSGRGAGIIPSAAMNPELRNVISDFDQAARLSPALAFAHYNKANTLVELGDLTSALASYRKAVELKPDFGEAYYNLAYVYFQLGNQAEGTANLSKAGELGVVPSYNLLKRMH